MADATNPISASEQAKAIRSISDDPREQVAFAVYFAILGTANSNRMKEIFAVAEANGRADQYRRTADVLLELFPEFRR